MVRQNDIKFQLKMVNSVIKTISKNKKRVSEINIGWKNKNKEEPRVLSFGRGKPLKEEVKYLKIELYLEYPLKK